MEIKVMKCPECGANLNINLDDAQGFCQYCGAKLVIIDNRKEKEINAKTKAIEAHIKEIETKKKYREAIAEDLASFKRKRMIAIIITMVVMAVIWVLIFSLSHLEKHALIMLIWVSLLIIGFELMGFYYIDPQRHEREAKNIARKKAEAEQELIEKRQRALGALYQKLSNCRPGSKRYKEIIAQIEILEKQ